ncbi:MAG TPA: nicotinate-nucleotide adenylyltransferase [Desulfobacterales bacterium]|nr:nicotinate-nucleotide adenylyltransferase [Desulfobacterales bacterium]
MEVLMPASETGVIHGRFQIVHNDHLKYLLAGKKLCRHLVVGITNPDPMLTRKESSDPKRSDPLANPLTYYERYILIGSVLAESGLKPQQFSVVPLPINLPDLYKYYVPMDAVFFLSIYDEWGRQKLRYFQSLGLKTHILREVSSEEKGISGSDIRSRMLCGQPWEHLIPPVVVTLLKKWDIPTRLKKIRENPLLQH